MTELADALTARLQALWGPAVEVTELGQLPGGASRESWDVRVRTAGQNDQSGQSSLSDQSDQSGQASQERRLILLRAAAARARTARGPERNVAAEAAAMTAARKAGVPVAEVYDHGSGPLGQAYLLMEHLDGETIPRRLLRDDAYAAVRPGLAYRLGEVLAKIHHIDPDEIPGLPRTDALGQLTELYQGLAEPRPALELGLRWLAEHQPGHQPGRQREHEPGHQPGRQPTATDTLVHGDFRTGNLMIAADGLRGVLDWELAHRGDPHQDLGWLCTKAWRFGSPHPVGGFGARADLMAGYAAGGGTPPDEPTQRWWELYGTVRWALLCRLQAERHLSGTEPSIELAVLGRRVCEQEWDTLLVLGYAAPLTVPDPLEGREYPLVRPHDRPAGAELLRAVGEFLATEIGPADPRLRFHARVAANALRIAQREALLAAAHEQSHQARVAALGCHDDAELCQAIRDGSLDHRFEDIAAAVRAATVDKLTVANPAHLARPG